MNSSKRLLINTTAMYAKMILSLFVTFFTTRIILQNLGVVDFGIFNLVAGGVSLLGFLNGSMSNTVQRFMAFELGANNKERISKTFSVSVCLHCLCAITVFVILELLFSFFFNHIFVIEVDRLDSAKIVYHIVVGITIISVITTPFSACFNAHEHIADQALIDFIIAVLKLIAAVALSLSSLDKLVFYVFLLLIIQVVDFLTKTIYCVICFSECRKFSPFALEIKILKGMSQFIVWNIIESMSWLAKGQGIAVLMNTFYGTIVNAAYGVANQVNGQLQFFSSTLLNSFQPQIYKHAGAGNNEKMLSHTLIAAKISYFMLLIMLCPIAFIINDLMRLWLVNVPNYAEVICLLLAFITMTNFMSNAVNVCVQANGNIKKYQLVSSLIILVSLPIGYLFYSRSNNVYLFFYIMIFVEYISVITKYKIAADVLKVKISYFIRGILVPCTFTLLLASVTSFLLFHVLKLCIEGFKLDVIYTLLDLIMIVILVFFIGLSKDERNAINTLYINKLLEKCKIR